MQSWTRRAFLLGSAALVAAVGPLRHAFAQPQKKLKIGIIGAGRMGGELGKLWAQAGYQVMLSARDLGPVQQLVAQIGPNAKAGTPQQAAAFGDVILVSVPWPALAQIGKDYAAELKGKMVLDTCNPSLRRDGPQAQAGLDKGAGIADQELLPGTKLVRAFNSIAFGELAAQAHRSGEPVGIELGGDDKAALEIAKQLVTDAGFEPVVVGDLVKSKLFDPGTPVYPKTMTAKEIKAALNLP